MDQFKKIIDKYDQLEYGCTEKIDKLQARPTFDQMYMSIAEIVGLRSTCLRGKIGAVIVRDTRIVSIGYNGAPASLGQCDEYGCIIDRERGGCIRTIHAEQNAIAYASRVGISIEGGTIYVTMSPCIDCAKLIIASGLKRIVFKEEYRKGYAIDYLKLSGLEIQQLDFGLKDVMKEYYDY